MIEFVIAVIALSLVTGFCAGWIAGYDVGKGRRQ